MTAVMTMACRASINLTADEREFLGQTTTAVAGLRNRAAMEALSDLLFPAREALEKHGFPWRATRNSVLYALMDGALHLGTVPQSWTVADWIMVRRKFGRQKKLALTVVAVRGYGVPLADGADNLYRDCHRIALAQHLYGRKVVDKECRRVRDELIRIGYSPDRRERIANQCVAELMLGHDAPSLNAVTDESLTRFAEQSPCIGSRAALRRVSIALAELGIVRQRLADSKPLPSVNRPTHLGVSPEWISWSERWRHASLRSPSCKRSSFSELMTVGRWLMRNHPKVTSPADWTMDLALEYVRYIDQRCVGDDMVVQRRLPGAGRPLAPGSKTGLLGAVRTFFHDLQDWDWIKCRFNPQRGFAVPRQVKRALQFKPRPIDDGYWLKLRTAALVLQPEDMPDPGWANTYFYPFELAQAVAVVWTFSGCRVDEIARLEVGCVYVEKVPEQTDPATGDVIPAFTQHMLRVPVNKTRGEFVKPVEEPLARAVAAWELVRPSQCKLLDRTAGRLTDHLFCYRAQHIGKTFVNAVIIPMLLRKAGLPAHDTRGAITSHRARATLATKLYNNTSGMTALEVMGWLGHARLSSSQHYIELTPTRLMTAFHRSAKLTENLRCVSVLVDRRPEPGEPMFRYDLGHGWCTNDAYAACAHRMACARCVFYEPAETFAAALVQQSDRYIRMLQELRLTEDERAATAGDAEAVKNLLVQLADKPTPDTNQRINL